MQDTWLSIDAGSAVAGPLFVLMTTKAGNSNAGHVYGMQLCDDDKWALIEYLKMLKPGDIKKDPLHKTS